MTINEWLRKMQTNHESYISHLKWKRIRKWNWTRRKRQYGRKVFDRIKYLGFAFSGDAVILDVSDLVTGSTIRKIGFQSHIIHFLLRGIIATLPVQTVDATCLPWCIYSKRPSHVTCHSNHKNKWVKQKGWLKQDHDTLSCSTFPSRKEGFHCIQDLFKILIQAKKKGFLSFSGKNSLLD